MKRIITFTIILLFLTFTSCSFAENQTETPWLHFKWSGGHSPYRFVELNIQNTDVVLVTFKKYNDQPINYKTTLNKQEKEMLIELIRSTAFFNEPETDNIGPFVGGLGLSELTISLADRKKDLKYGNRPNLKPLTNYLWLIINQAIIWEDFKNKKDIYSVLCAFNPRAAARKALQPEVFLEPVKKFTSQADEFSDLSYGLQTLVLFLTPEEFSNYVALEIKKANKERRSLILITLATHECYGNFPNKYLQALFPIYLEELQRNYLPPKRWGEPDQTAYSRFLDLLGEKQYIPAIPYILKLVNIHTKPYMQGYLYALPDMGEVALPYIFDILSSNRKELRIVGAEMLVLSARKNPESGASDPVSAEEFKRIKIKLESQFIPMLDKMAKEDLDMEVREIAKQSSEEIKNELLK